MMRRTMLLRVPPPLTAAPGVRVDGEWRVESTVVTTGGIAHARPEQRRFDVSG